MEIVINKEISQILSNSFILNNNWIHYTVEEKEYFFENTLYYFFLKSNYSENYIHSIIENKEHLTPNKIYEAFKKDGFWIVINKKNDTISLNRDLSGLCTGYFYNSDNYLHVADNVHKVAKINAKELSKDSVFQLLYFDYLWDGQTIYKNIEQVKIGGKIIFNTDLIIEKTEFLLPNILCNENSLSEKENILTLRKEIVKAHKKYVNDKNIVFLSGGIDSVAMLIALDDLVEKEKIINHSFRVKGTTQDETIYAKSIANFLNVKLNIIERDISNEINEKIFIKEILKMNNPYPGMWTFGNQINNNKKTNYFAGQDTRLHTPSLNILDELAFTIFTLSKKGLNPIFYIFNLLLYPFKVLANLLMTSKTSKSKIFLGLRRALYIFNTEQYVNLVYFKVDKQNTKIHGLPLHYFNKITKKYNFTAKNIKTKRSLYNAIVSKKWLEQYVNDMRYMIDMVNSQGGKLAMPFYDMNLANFSASIPFDLAIKTMKGKSQFGDKNSIVYKYVLREALIDKIDQKTYLRSKAVSRIGHLVFNQGLDKILKNILAEDFNTRNSLIKNYNLEKFTKRFIENKQNWILTDDKYLLKIYYLASLIIYNRELSK